MVDWSKILSKRGVIKLLRISPVTYRKYIKKGFLAKIKRKVGNQYLFDKDEIMAELEKMSEE